MAISLAALSLTAGDTSRQMTAAETSLQGGDYRKAVEILTQLIAASPGADPEVYLMLAVSKLNLDDMPAAIAAAEQGLKVFPKSDRIASFYVGLLASALPLQQATPRLEGMLAANPGSAILAKALGKALMAQDRDDPRIVSLLSSASAALPRDAEAQYLYGEWSCLHEKEDQCITLLKRSLQLSSATNYSAAVLLNGMIAAAEDKKGDAAEARSAFERAFAAYLKLEPPVADVPFAYVKFLLTAGDAAAAARIDSGILRRNPGFGPAHLQQARFLFRDGKAAQAVEEADLAIGLLSQDKAELRAAHSFLVKANSALGREVEAELNRRWVDANP